MEPRPVMTTSRESIRSVHGFTLIEVIATLSLLLVVAVAAAGMLESISEVGLRYKHSLQERGAVRRLASVIRKDSLLSTDIVSDQGDWPLQIVLPSRTVQYQWDAAKNRVVRLLHARESDGSSGKLLGTEMFQLTDQCEPRFIVQKERLVLFVRESNATANWVVEAWR